MRGDDWRTEALCLREPDLWFPDGFVKPLHVAQAEEAKGWCRLCPVLAECRSWVMEFEAGKPESGRHGVCAGLTPRQRARLDQSASEAVPA